MSDKILKDDFVNLVGIRNEELKNEAALYIMDKYPKIFTDFETARKTAKFLIEEHNAKIENFRLGQMDHQIRKCAEYEKMRQQSKKDSQKKEVDVKLKIKKKQIAKNVMVGLVVGVIATTGIVYVSNKLTTRNISGAMKEEGQVVLPTDEAYIGNPDYESKTNIVKDNTVVAGVLKDGSQVVSHKYDGMAKSILDHYENEQENIDYYIIDVFNSFKKENSFKNMDLVFYELQQIISSDEKYNELSDINNHKNIVRYLFSKIEYNDPNYDDILKSIDAYENNKVSDNEQYYLDYLVDEFINSRKSGGRD